MVDHTSDQDLYEKTVRSEDSPDPYLLVKLWTSWAVLDGVFGLFSFIVWISILRSKHARASPFNVYLLFLMLPDWFYNFNFCITSTMNVIKGEYWGFKMCMWQSWYSVWGIGANAWLNGIMGWEIHRMLRSSHMLRRYHPPTRRQVVVNGVAVYALVGVFSALGSLELKSFYPLDSTLHGSLTCGPKPFDQNQTLLVWLFFAPLFVLIPYCYVLYSVLDISWRRLLPKRGKRRILSIYFFRIVAIFLVMWGPVAFLIYFFNEVVIDDDKEHWSIFAVAVWAHFQAVLSAAVTLTKPDISQAVKDFLCCKSRDSSRSLAHADEPSSQQLSAEVPQRSFTRPPYSRWSFSRRIHFFLTGNEARKTHDQPNSEGRFVDNPAAQEHNEAASNVAEVWRSHETEFWSDIPVQSHVDFQFEDESEHDGGEMKMVDDTVDMHKDMGSSPDETPDDIPMAEP